MNLRGQLSSAYCYFCIYIYALTHGQILLTTWAAPENAELSGYVPWLTLEASNFRSTVLQVQLTDKCCFQSCADLPGLALASALCVAFLNAVQ